MSERVHVPIGADVELEEAIAEGGTGGGGGGLKWLTENNVGPPPTPEVDLVALPNGNVYLIGDHGAGMSDTPGNNYIFVGYDLVDPTQDSVGINANQGSVMVESLAGNVKLRGLKIVLATPEIHLGDLGDASPPLITVDETGAVLRIAVPPDARDWGLNLETGSGTLATGWDDALSKSSAQVAYDQLGFFDALPVDKPAAPTTAQAIANALAALGLIHAGGTIRPFELGYAEKHTNVTVTATGEAGDTILTVTFTGPTDGATVLEAEFYTPGVQPGAGDMVQLHMEANLPGAGSVILGDTAAIGTLQAGVTMKRRFTPPAGANGPYTLGVYAFTNGVASGHVLGGNGTADYQSLPMRLSVREL